MAKDFKSYSKSGHQVTAGPTQGGASMVGDAAPSTGRVIMDLSVANTRSSGTVDVTSVSVAVYDSSAAAFVYLVRAAPIPAGTTLVVVDDSRRVSLESGDEVHVIVGNASDRVDVLLSVWNQVN